MVVFLCASRRFISAAAATGANADAATQEVGAGFDQETAAVLMARIAVHKAEKEEAFDILRWLDRTLIRLVSKFATLTKNDPSSFRLAPVRNHTTAWRVYACTGHSGSCMRVALVCGAHVTCACGSAVW